MKKKIPVDDETMFLLSYTASSEEKNGSWVKQILAENVKWLKIE